jgi:hypothetical protein
MQVQEVVMSQWPVVNEEMPAPFQHTEHEESWLAPQCMCPLSCERPEAHPVQEQAVSLGFIAWVRTVSVFQKHRH